jgi:hypothetical protein
MSIRRTKGPLTPEANDLSVAKCVPEAEESTRSEGLAQYLRSASNPNFCYEATLAQHQLREELKLSVGLIP